MSIQKNEPKSTLINYSATDQTINFNSIFVTTAGALKYDDASGTTLTTGTIPVGKFEVQGQKIYKVGSTLAGIALGY